MTDAARAAEQAARESYGKLLAIVSARTRDIAAAEDALAGAFRAALQSWPVRGVPRNPQAWLVTAARREAGRAARHARVRAAGAEVVEMLHEERRDGSAPSPDDRLRLMLVCAHPSVEPAARTPLMLQCVLGLDAARIAGAFLSTPAAMGQRLARAKARLRAEGAAFEEPGPADLGPRLGAVLDAIYAAFGAGWDAASGAEGRVAGLAEEALWLGRVAAASAPGCAEALGLLALMLHVEARRPARRDAAGRYVPLDAQDPALWRGDMVAEAERALAAAAALGAPGRFQIEAAIQSAHVQRAVTGRGDWAAVAALYAFLDRLAPSVGATVARAAALGRAGRPADGLALLDDLDPTQVAAHQPFFAARAALRAAAGDAAAAADYDRAIGLSEDPAVRDFLAAAKLAAGMGAR